MRAMTTCQYCGEYYERMTCHKCAMKNSHRFDPSPMRGDPNEVDKELAKLREENERLKEKTETITKNAVDLLTKGLAEAEERGARWMAEIVGREFKSMGWQLSDTEKYMQLWRERGAK